MLHSILKYEIMEFGADRLSFPDPFCMSIVNFRDNYLDIIGYKAGAVLGTYACSRRRFHDRREYLLQFSYKLCRARFRVGSCSIFISRRERADCFPPFQSSASTTAFLKVDDLRRCKRSTRLRWSCTFVTRSVQLFLRGLYRFLLLVFICKVAAATLQRNRRLDNLFPILESCEEQVTLDQDCRNEGIYGLRQHGAAMTSKDLLEMQFMKTESSIGNCVEMRLSMHLPKETTSDCVEHRTKSNAFVKLAAGRVSPAVVRLDTERICNTRTSAKHDRSTHWFGDELVRDRNEFFRERGMGSGFVVDAKNGLIVTNLHVIDGAANVKVFFGDGKEFDAKIIGVDENSDLAIVKVSNQVGQLLPEAPLGNSETVELGDWVIAIGNPFGLDNSVSLGIISNLQRTASEVGISGKQFDLFQTDCAINPGSSGGPLVNEFGEVIGINTAIRGDAEGIAFAIPINNVKHVIESLSKRSSM